MRKKLKTIRVNDLTHAQRLELRIKTLALLRFNHHNLRRTSRESHVAESTIRNWLKEDTDVAREIAAEKAVIQDQQRQEQQHELTEKRELSDLHNARLISEQAEKITVLAMDGVTAFANELVESLRTSLLSEKPKFYDRMMAFGIVFDKIQIFHGNPTAIHASLGRRLSRDERAERTKQLLETAEQRRKKLKVVGGTEDRTSQGS
jgi:hypothetical protein